MSRETGQSGIIFLFFVFLLLYPIPYSTGSTDHLTLDSQLVNHSIDLYEIDYHGIFEIDLELDMNSQTDVNFQYLARSINLIQSSVPLDELTQEYSKNFLIINGTIKAGQVIQTQFNITECYGDSAGGIHFNFSRAIQITTSISIDFKILSEGDRGCGGQLHPSGLNGVNISMLLFTFVLISRGRKRFLYSRKGIPDGSRKTPFPTLNNIS